MNDTDAESSPAFMSPLTHGSCYCDAIDEKTTTPLLSLINPPRSTHLIFGDIVLLPRLAKPSTNLQLLLIQTKPLPFT